MRMRLHNIGPLRDADVDFSRLTILVGPNGSGKTTLTSVFYAVCLAHRAAVVDALEALDHRFLRETRRSNLSKLSQAIVKRWEAAFLDRLEFELRRCCAPDLASLARARRGGRFAGPRIEVETAEWCIPFRLDGDDLSVETESRVYRLPRLKLARDADRRSARAAATRTLDSDMPRRAVYFPAGRSGLVHTHAALSGLMMGALSGGYFQDATVGAIPGATADFMQLVAQVGTARRAQKTSPLARRLERNLLRGAVRFDDDDPASRQLVFRPEGHDREWPIQNMATSVAELSPLVLYLRHVAHSKDALLIDEPESHLHPQNQVALADALVALSRRMAWVIVATHSEFLVSALSNEVISRASKVTDDDVLRAYNFKFHAPDRGLGVDVSPLAVEAGEGFEVADISEVADRVFEESIRIYNDVHAVGDA
jgi:predicted ATPase